MYGDIFAGHARTRKPKTPEVAAERDLVVEDAATGFCGAVVGIERTYDGDFVRLEDGARRTRLFAMREAAFLIDGRPVTLVRPVPRQQKPAAQRSASGSTKVEGLRARTALPSRIWVEGVHDAALVERVWGHDLRVEGVVVEHLEGLDNLGDRLAEFRPGPGRKVGVLVDHLVTGSKEERLTQGLGPHVMVTAPPTSTCGRPCGPSRSASPPGRRSRAARTGRPACAPRSAGGLRRTAGAASTAPSRVSATSRRR